jgi:hypothetical protein
VRSLMHAIDDEEKLSREAPVYSITFDSRTIVRSWSSDP